MGSCRTGVIECGKTASVPMVMGNGIHTKGVPYPMGRGREWCPLVVEPRVSIPAVMTGSMSRCAG